MADEEDIAALVIDNGSGMCKGRLFVAITACFWLNLILIWGYRSWIRPRPWRWGSLGRAKQYLLHWGVNRGEWTR